MTRPQLDGRQPWRERQEVERAYYEEGATIQISDNGEDGPWHDVDKPRFDSAWWWRVKPKPVEPRRFIIRKEPGHAQPVVTGWKTDVGAQYEIEVTELPPGWKLVPPGGA